MAKASGKLVVYAIDLLQHRSFFLPKVPRHLFPVLQCCIMHTISDESVSVFIATDIFGTKLGRLNASSKSTTV
ncbi:MAG: hypothetical protein ACREA3_06605 [Nitrosotalea sp.]